VSESPSDADARDAPDRRDGRLYLIDDALRLAVEVAFTTSRPLLLRGAPGSGKSTLAAFIARNLNYRYYEQTVTAATRSRDLLWRFDSVRRLSDAQVRGHDDPPLRDVNYIEPGVLWWAFNRESARRRGVKAEDEPPATAAVEPNEELNATRLPDCAVVLIDEIDKADPDVPNGLLEPLSSITFTVHETGTTVRREASRSTGAAADGKSSLLIVLTTNEERDLPPAFIRRCIVHELEHPDEDRLVEIARLHHSGRAESFEERLCRALATRVIALREQAEEQGARPPGTAEYLDAVRACTTLGITPDGSRAWQVLASATLTKERSPSAGAT
jgi:MoxR-like ATPase